MDTKHKIGRTFFPYSSIIKKRNTLADAFFYDVDSLTTDEQQQMINDINREGSILIIPPKSTDRKLTSYRNAREFLKGDHNTVSKFVIAGVGSSDLGGASLARNVADYYGEDVATIVAGYGMADMMAEAVGGWFSLGQKSRMASYLESMGDFVEAEDDIELHVDVHHYVAGHPDSKTLLRLLLSESSPIKFILGHSKGCLSLANALNGLVSVSSESKIKKCAEEIRIITTGAVTELPDIFQEHAYQYLGGIDWFGWLNSSHTLKYHKIANAWHHTNKKLPFAMDIAKVLSQYEEERGETEEKTAAE